MRVEQQPTLFLVVLPNVSLRNSTLWSAPLKIMTSSIKCLSLGNMADVTHSKSPVSLDLFLLLWPKVDIPLHITQTWTKPMTLQLSNTFWVWWSLQAGNLLLSISSQVWDFCWSWSDWWLLSIETELIFNASLCLSVCLSVWIYSMTFWQCKATILRFPARIYFP